MRRVYLTGQTSLGNRGCEAIVRSTVGLLRGVLGEVEVLVPSLDAEADRRQWPDAEDSGVRFVRGFLPDHGRYWVHVQRLPLPALKRVAWPFSYPDWLKADMASADAVLSVGGDNYSFDYRTPSLIVAQDALAMQLGKPVVLWGASVGPFDSQPGYLNFIRRHLDRMEAVALRESVSVAYARERLGLREVVEMSDPAFTLRPEPIDTAPFWPRVEGGEGVLGVNLSPLLERYRREGQDLRAETQAFLRHAVQERGLSVLLIPHVMPLNGAAKNNDAVYLESLLAGCRELGDRVRAVPAGLNAAQTKHVISKLRFFIGARTHATIAALSSAVPTVSIAYSVKARGINRDLFGDEEMVLPTPELSEESLRQKLDWLFENEARSRALLDERLPVVRRSCEVAMERVVGLLERGIAGAPRQRVSG